jgi:hypothetical protein
MLNKDADKKRCTNTCREENLKENAKREDHHTKNSRKRKQDSVKRQQDKTASEALPAKDRATGKNNEKKSLGTAAKESEDFSKKRLKVEHLENNKELAG